MLATLDTDLADDVMPSDEDAPVSLSDVGHYKKNACDAPEPL